MGVSQVRSYKSKSKTSSQSLSRNIKLRNKNKVENMESVDFDWGDMISPADRIITESISPYVISQPECSTLSDADELDIQDIELSTTNTLEKFDDIEILKRSSLAARDLKFRIVNELSNDYDTAVNKIIEYVHWLKQSMIILSDRIGQKPLPSNCDDETRSDNSSDHKNELKDDYLSIGRNSYKFCDFGHSCSFNYSLEDRRDCYSQHFVYPLILSDIQNLIDHILMDDGSYNSNVQTKEVITSINTITYVINHMYNELADLKKNNQIGYSYYVKRKLSLKCIIKNAKRRNRKKA